MGRTLVSKKSFLLWDCAVQAPPPKSARQRKMCWHFIRRSDEYESSVRKAKFALSATAFLLKVNAITSGFLSTPETIQTERWLQAYHRSIPGSIQATRDRKSTRLNSSHLGISYAVFCF